ncbi:biliverdin-producing heme oxygenase [Phenylobacterium sp. LjRoot219]|uniref:biliverdin-producing heme oxygenase n=1 Tax=Phenylobacterium sp. LjRoot219 TaxID=3342283 RepID=UPI003ED07113
MDAIYSRFDLSQPGDYRAFLEAQYGCFAPLEQALTAAGAAELLDDWPTRRRAPLLAADLADLGAGRPTEAPSPVALPSPAALLGAIYVLEGSRFGGALLARRLPAGAPGRFLGGAADPAAWRALLAVMDRELQAEPELAAAITAARAVFAAFAASGQLRLEGA